MNYTSERNHRFLIHLFLVFTILLICTILFLRNENNINGVEFHQLSNDKITITNTETHDENKFHQRNYDASEFYTKTSVFEKGRPIWNIAELQNNFNEFDKNFAIKGNKFGMLTAHQYAVYSIIKILQPKIIIESGVWQGKTSQLIRRTTNATLISITPNNPANKVTNQECICGKQFSDFNKLGSRWAEIKDKSSVLIIFDDHQSGVRRLKEVSQFGFKHFIVEDNYVNGDNFSLKQLFSKIPTAVTEVPDNFGRNKNKITPIEWQSILNDAMDKIDVYAEFPPLNKHLSVMFYLHNYSDRNNYDIKYQNMYGILAEGLGLHVNNIEEYTRYNSFAYVKLK